MKSRKNTGFALRTLDIIVPMVYPEMTIKTIGTSVTKCVCCFTNFYYRQ
jgi:hypothetical protein